MRSEPPSRAQGSGRHIQHGKLADERGLGATARCSAEPESRGSYPLLFLDEFDSSPSNFSLLLPLLWDGGLNLGQRELRLGKAVIVLAGSDRALPGIMEHARSMRHDVSDPLGHNSKLVDLLSRINGGVLVIPPFHDAAHGIDRRADKVCIAVQLLRSRYGDTLKRVPVSLLRFIANTEFRYGVRSIAHLIDTIPCNIANETLTNDTLGLPVNSPTELKKSSLAYHLVHEDQAHGVIEIWEEASTHGGCLPVTLKPFEYLPPHFSETHAEFYLMDAVRRLLWELESAV